MEPTEWRSLSQEKIKHQAKSENPCIRCGACCSYFRVAFFWRETENLSEIGITGDYRVPAHLTQDVDSFRRCMTGTTEKKGNRCVALQGKVGEEVSCQIYPNRPSPCRAFPASYENGKQNKRCDEARAAHGPKPIKMTDW